MSYLITPGKCWLLFVQCQVWSKTPTIPFSRYAIQLYFDVSARGHSNLWKFPKPFVQRPVACYLGMKFASDLREAGVPLYRLPNIWLDGQDLLADIPEHYPILFSDDWWDIGNNTPTLRNLLTVGTELVG